MYSLSWKTVNSERRGEGAGEGRVERDRIVSEVSSFLLPGGQGGRRPETDNGWERRREGSRVWDLIHNRCSQDY